MAARDIESSGIKVVRSRLIFDKKKRNEKFYEGIYRILNKSVLSEIILVFLAVYSVMGIFFDGYGVKIGQAIFCVSLIFMASFFEWYYRGKHSWKFLVGFVTVQIAVLLLSYRQILSGMTAITNDMITTINANYGGSIDRLHGGENYKVYAVLILCFYVMWPMAKGIVMSMDYLHFILCAFPFLLLYKISGGEVSVFYFILLLSVFVTLLILSKMQMRKKYLGMNKGQVYHSNAYRFGKIRYKLALLGLILCVLAMLPAWYVSSLAKIPVIDELSQKMIPVRTSGIRFLTDFLPKISGGKLKFSVDGIGGGSSGGILGEVEGTYYQKKETLKVSVDKQPTETIYLRGYIGNVYTGNSWIYTDEQIFHSNVTNWTTEGYPEAYIKNNPFLRTMYAIHSDVTEYSNYQPSTMKVENMNEEHSYTYTPYYAYINDYYEIKGGDGTIEGQSRYDDSYSFVFKNDYDNIMDKWNKDGVHGTLDSIENSYKYYVNEIDTKLGDADLSELVELCQQKKEEWDNKFQSGMTSQQIEDLTAEKYEDVKNFVRKTLLERCEFEDKSVKLPKGKDFIHYFMFERKKGDSTAFASTATMMFRICGIPARYVEGYVIPTDLFSDGGNNSFTAILQDDNAHAWAEIYVPKKGFTYVETTPGFEGMVTNVEMPEDDKEDTPKKENEKQENQENPTPEEIIRENSSLITYYLVMGVCLLLMVTLLVVVIHYYVLKRRNLGMDKYKGRNEEYRVKQIFTTIFNMFVFDGMDENTDVTEESFIDMVSEQYPHISRNEMQKYMECVLLTNYGDNQMKEWYLPYSLEVYKTIRKDIYHNLKFYKKWIFKFWKAY